MLSLYQPKFSPPCWHNALENVAEIVVKLHEVLLKSLLLLLVKVLKKSQDTLLSFDLVLKLLLKFLELGRVLVEPLNAMSVLPRERLKACSLLLNVLHQLLHSLVLLCLFEDLLIKSFNLLDQQVNLIVFALKVIHLKREILDLHSLVS